MSCGLQATSPPKRRQFTPGSLASGMDCHCASQKSGSGERTGDAAQRGRMKSDSSGFQSSGRSVDDDSMVGAVDMDTEAPVGD